jgi:hypothetical protein
MNKATLSEKLAMSVVLESGGEIRPGDDVERLEAPHRKLEVVEHTYTSSVGPYGQPSMAGVYR